MTSHSRKAAVTSKKKDAGLKNPSAALEKPLLEKWYDARNLDGSESVVKYNDVIDMVQDFEKELLEYIRPDEHEVIKRLLLKHIGRG